MRFPIIALIAVLILSTSAVLADRKGHVHKAAYELENIKRFNDLNETFDNYHLGTPVPYTTDDYRE